MNVKNIEIPMQNTTFETPNLPNEIKKNFEDWCKIKNIPYSDNLLEAVALIFEGAMSMFKEMSNPWHFCNESMPEEFTVCKILIKYMILSHFTSYFNEPLLFRRHCLGHPQLDSP